MPSKRSERSPDGRGDFHTVPAKPQWGVRGQTQAAAMNTIPITGGNKSPSSSDDTVVRELFSTNFSHILRQVHGIRPTPNPLRRCSFAFRRPSPSMFHDFSILFSKVTSAKSNSQSRRLSASGQGPV